MDANVHNVLSDEAIKAAVTKGAEMLANIGNAVNGIRQGSKEVFETFKDIFPMRTDYRTGKADIKGFCSRIWGSLPDDLKTPQEGKPGKYYEWTTADAKHGNVHARGLKALSNWMRDNITELYKVEKPVVDESGAEVVDESGKPVVEVVPAFQAIANADEKETKAILKAMKTIMDSDRITEADKKTLGPIFEKIGKYIAPELESAEAERKAKLEDIKHKEQPETEEVTAEDEKPAVNA